MKTEQTEQSLGELMHEAFVGAMNILYKDNADGRWVDLIDNIYNILTEDELDMLFGWADGLEHNYYQKHASCQTSLYNIINFDIEKFEQKVVRHIEQMRQISERLALN